MTQFSFGTGTLICVRTDAANTMPAFLGTLQDVTVNFDSTLKPLIGQKRVAVALGAAQLKISGDAKFARIQMTQMTNLMVGGTTTAGTQQILPATGEARTVPAPSGPYTVQTTNHTTFQQDLGVFYASSGIQLQPVAAASEATGKYSVDASTGTYTFAVGDASAAILIYYRYTAATGYENVFANPAMGSAPVFQLNFQNQWTDQSGNVKTDYLTLNACMSTKLSMPFKNQDWMIEDLGFEAMADAAGNVFTYSTTE